MKSPQSMPQRQSSCMLQMPEISWVCLLLFSFGPSLFFLCANKLNLLPCFFRAILFQLQNSCTRKWTTMCKKISWCCYSLVIWYTIGRLTFILSFFTESHFHTAATVSQPDPLARQGSRLMLNACFGICETIRKSSPRHLSCMVGLWEARLQSTVRHFRRLLDLLRAWCWKIRSCRFPSSFQGMCGVILLSFSVSMLNWAIHYEDLRFEIEMKIEMKTKKKKKVYLLTID